MEKLIVEEIGFIKEEKYQRIKKEINKTDNYFTMEELKILKKRLKKIDVILT